jgi:hypothetical protein
MNITIEERMDNIEQQLQEIKKELEESLNRYKVSQTFPFTNGDISHWDAAVFYPEGSLVKWFDGTIVKAKSDTCGSTDDWYDPRKVDKYGNLLGEVK